MSKSNPLLAFHVVFSAYGFWLPNAESGSGSDFVRSDALTKFGPAHPVTHRKSVANKACDWEMRRRAQAELKYKPVKFTGLQARAIGRGFATEFEKFGGTCFAACVMPTHTHLVLGPHRYDIRRFCGRLKGAATKQLRAENIHPFQDQPNEDGTLPSPWGVDPWVVYCFSVEDVVRAIDYAERNAVKARKPMQKWSFVSRYDAPYIPRGWEDWWEGYCKRTPNP